MNVPEYQSYFHEIPLLLMFRPVQLLARAGFGPVESDIKIKISGPKQAHPGLEP